MEYMKTTEIMAREVTASEVKGKKRIEFVRADYLVLLVIAAAAWVYVNGYPIFGRFTLTIFAAVYMGANIWYVKKQGRSLSGESIFYSVLVMAAAFWQLTESGDGEYYGFMEVQPYMLLFFHGVGIYLILTLNQSRIRQQLDESSIIDMLRGSVIIPVTYCYMLVAAVISLVEKLIVKIFKRENKNQERTRQIVIGFCIGIPILCVLIPLLMSADRGFALFAEGILSRLFNLTDVLEIILNYRNIILFLIACYLFALSYGSGKAALPETKGMSRGFTVTAFTCSVLVCGLYAVFFLVKISNAVATVSQGQGTFVYSEYARAGFFELCAIAFLNFCFFYFVYYFADQSNKKIKVLQTILCVETLAFIMLALYKMYLYIGVYGFTFKRVFTSWFMLVLFVGFLLFLFKVWRNLNAIKYTILFGSITFLMLGYGWVLIC